MYYVHTTQEGYTTKSQQKFIKNKTTENGMRNEVNRENQIFKLKENHISICILPFDCTL